MRGLAQFIMTGKRQAVFATMLLGILPLVNLLNPTIVGLWILRKGLIEATTVIAWALLPLLGWAYAGDVAPFIMLVGICGLASVLRATNSWEFTLCAAILVGLIVEAYFRLNPAMLDVLFQQVQMLMQNNTEVLRREEIRDVVISLFGSVYMFLAITLTMLARWMQATLFNPGGFQGEFHQLRVGHKVTLILVCFMVMASFGILISESWLVYFTLPLIFSGIALVHAVCAQRGYPVMVLVAFYVLFLLPVTLQLVVLLAVIDSWYDFRSRFKKV